jgi:hypothetical protein
VANTLRALGDALDLTLPRLRRRIKARLLPALARPPPGARRLLRREFTELYLEGGIVGLIVHGTLLGLDEDALTAPSPLPAAAAAHAELLLTLLQRLLEREPSEATVATWGMQAGESTVWRGVDRGGEHVARVADATTKTWVRAWDRADHRDWHDRLNGVTIGVDELFILPGGPHAGLAVYGPRDFSIVNSPAEWLGCGHALSFGGVAGPLYTPPGGTPLFGNA